MERDTIEKIENPLSFYGLKYNSFNINEFHEYIMNIINNHKKSIIFGYSLVLLPKFKTYPEIFNISNTFDFFVIDGRGLYSIMKLCKTKGISDFSLPDIVYETLKIADRERYSVLLFGASEETNNNACNHIKKIYPNINLLKGINGYYEKKDEDIILKEINKISPDIILIGISSPQKEKLALKIRTEINCRVIIPCGGVIDILGGKTKREPKLIKKLNLTWLYRFFQEPKRLFKTIFVNGLSVIFILLPVFFVNVYILKNKDFSIPKFYGIK